MVRLTGLLHRQLVRPQHGCEVVEHQPGLRLATWCLAVAVLGGCGGPTVPLSYVPSDLDDGERLARAVAAEADCDGFDYFDDGEGWWSFECQFGTGPGYVIVTVRDEQTRTARREDLLKIGPVKQGAAYLVQEDSGGRKRLEAFSGDLVEPAT